MAAIPSTIHTNFTPPSSSSSCLRSFERLRSPFLAFTKRIGSKRACLLIEKADLAGRGGGARCWFKFGNSGVDAESAGIYGNQSREDFNRDDVEQYFNYTGMLAEEGSYDKMEALLRQKIHPLDILLMLAVSERDRPKIEELLRAGADFDVKDADGRTALDRANDDEMRHFILSISAQNA